MEWVIVIVLILGLIGVGLEKLKEAKAEKMAQARNAAKLTYANVDLDDEDEDDDEDLAPPELRIRYEDEHGRRTRRDISIYAYGATDRKFQAYCHLRRATRDFLFTRIVEAIDLDTGEVLTKADVFRRVHPNRFSVPKEIR